LNSVKNAVGRIRARGGQVLFVRTPASGAVLMGELRGFPRKAYWDRLLATTGCPGVYFADCPATAHLYCPEWSHLSPADAVVYTKNLVQILQGGMGWHFEKNQAQP
jgi:hypothetical protein